MSDRTATLKRYASAVSIVGIGILLAALSYISKYLGKLGAKTERFGIAYTEIIRRVVGPEQMKEVRERILGDFHLIVDDYKSPKKPESDYGGWSEWHLSINESAQEYEKSLDRGETIASLCLAVVAIPLVFVPLDQLLSLGLNVLFLILAAILISAVSLRIAVMDLLAFTDPSTKERKRLKNMWAWNYWILSQTAVMVVILGVVTLGRISQEMRDETVREISELPRRITEGEEINKYRMIKRILSAAYNTKLDSSPGAE